MSDVTRILSEIEHGDARASARLLPLVYEELRALATSRMSQERPGQTLKATALVHEAYLRLVGAEDKERWNSRGHFFGAASEAMRRILVEQARRKKSIKHGGSHTRVELAHVEPTDQPRKIDLLALDEALGKLEREQPEKAELVKLRYFAGLTIAQAADALGISTSTADNYWAYAKSWLKVELRKD